MNAQRCGDSSAGATGPLGARITQELLLSDFKVTAGTNWETSSQYKFIDL